MDIDCCNIILYIYMIHMIILYIYNTYDLRYLYMMQCHMMQLIIYEVIMN